jgi:GTPase SAR1 family protein
MYLYKMKIVIVGPPASGKTTLLHKIIRMNDRNNFSMIVDGIENLVAGGLAVNLPNLSKMIITAQTLDNVPLHILEGALILRTPDIRV